MISRIKQAVDGAYLNRYILHEFCVPTSIYVSTDIVFNKAVQI
jgi:hypothetical protein